MLVKPSIHTLKSGQEITIREAKVSDAESFIDCVHSYLKSNMIPLTKEEFNAPIGEHQQWIKKFIDGENDVLLVAEFDDQIVGNIDLASHTRKMLSHTAYLGMGIHKDWQNKGIGTLLLDKAVGWADQNPAIEILWLQVFGSNVGGIKLYEKKGFREDGRQKKFIKTMDGEYVDNVIMTRKKQG